MMRPIFAVAIYCCPPVMANMNMTNTAQMPTLDIAAPQIVIVAGGAVRPDVWLNGR
jgi:hypothetical protein